jgi:hypothetical protein
MCFDKLTYTHISTLSVPPTCFGYYFVYTIVYTVCAYFGSVNKTHIHSAWNEQREGLKP